MSTYTTSPISCPPAIPSSSASSTSSDLSSAPASASSSAPASASSSAPASASTASDYVPASRRQIFPCLEDIVARLRKLGRCQTAENYTSAMHSLRHFCAARRITPKITWTDLTSDMMSEYESWLRSRGISMNTVSFYNRILRAAYNRAANAGLTASNAPFTQVYTGVAKTVKRAIPLKYIRRMKALDLTLNPDADFARDMFLFSFYTRGMSFVDMAYLKKSDLRSGTLTYRRRKTGQKLTIKWEPCMQAIVDKYSPRSSAYMPISRAYSMPTSTAPLTPKPTTTSTPTSTPTPAPAPTTMPVPPDYLLPIITPGQDESAQWSQYKRTLRLVNKHLKTISSMIGLSAPLTTYVSRHSWASIAKTANVPLSVISEGLGHDSELTTRIYLASLDTSVVDRANRSILNLL